MEKNKKSIEINLNQEVALGIYSNLAVISHAESEFVVDFVTLLPGLEKGEVRSRVIMSPLNAKRLLKALNDNIRRFESAHGTITDDAPNATIPITGPHSGIA